MKIIIKEINPEFLKIKSKRKPTKQIIDTNQIKADIDIKISFNKFGLIVSNVIYNILKINNNIYKCKFEAKYLPVKDKYRKHIFEHI